MFSNLYPLSNTTFINLRRAQFLYDLITGVSIDICAHIFQTIRKTAARSAARGCIPFCSLIMKFILREGINPSSDGKMMTRPCPISMITLQASKSHSFRTPKSEPPTYETPPFSSSLPSPILVSTFSLNFIRHTTRVPKRPMMVP